MSDEPANPRGGRPAKVFGPNKLKMQHTSGVIVAWDADEVYKHLRRWARRWGKSRLMEIELMFGPVGKGVKLLLENSAALLAAGRHAYYLATIPNQPPTTVTALYKSSSELTKASKDQDLAAMTMAEAEAKAKGKKATAHETLLAGLKEEHPANHQAGGDGEYEFETPGRPKKGRPKLSDVIHKAIPFEPGGDYGDFLDFVKKN